MQFSFRVLTHLLLADLSELPSVIWWAIGGSVASIFELIEAQLFPRAKADDGALPSDMSTMSLVGGGFIAGDALAALAMALYLLAKL